MAALPSASLDFDRVHRIGIELTNIGSINECQHWKSRLVNGTRYILGAVRTINEANKRDEKNIHLQAHPGLVGGCINGVGAVAEG